MGNHRWWQNLNIPSTLRAKLLESFTITRDGYCRWYKGAPRFAAPKSTPPGEVVAEWERRQKVIDAAEKVETLDVAASGTAPYRYALSEFLQVQKARVGAKKNRIEERTYHNYVKELNAFGRHVVDGMKVADTPLGAIGPRHFSSYARTFGHYKASGFDSIVTRIGTLFRWAIEMEYIDRFRPGPEFVRPAKQDIRDDRIDLTKSFTVPEVAKLYVGASHTVRCWIALGMCCAFNNADIGNLTRDVVDLKSGVIDFRRRKTGKVRRVIPLPVDVVNLLNLYQRPDPAAGARSTRFFITEHGNPYSRSRSRDGTFKPSDSISRVFAKLMDATQTTRIKGRNFSGLRTTFYNRFQNMPGKAEYDIERKIIMGRAKGDVDLDHYLEDVGLDRLRHVVDHVWDQVRSDISKLRQGATSPAAVPAAPVDRLSPDPSDESATTPPSESQRT